MHDRAAAPLRQLRRHVPVHQLPVDPRRRLERLDRVRHDGGLAARPRRAARGGQHHHAATPARPPPAASATTGSATCPRRWRRTSARRRSRTAPATSRCRRRSGDPGVGRQLRVAHPAQRDDLDDRRPGRRPGTRSSTTSTPSSAPASPTRPRPARSGPSCKLDHHHGEHRRTWAPSASSRCAGALVTLGEQQIAEIG